jgi:hypothetical protein
MREKGGKEGGERDINKITSSIDFCDFSSSPADHDTQTDFRSNTGVFFQSQDQTIGLPETMMGVSRRGGR